MEISYFVVYPLVHDSGANSCVNLYQYKFCNDKINGRDFIKQYIL